MTKEQTRLLGIEFERRLQTMDPTMLTINKIDTDDIYAYLNEYQQTYVKQLYVADDQVPAGSKTSIRIADQIKPLITNKMLAKPSQIDSKCDGRYIIYKLPEDYYMYVRSSCEVDVAYNDMKNAYVPNILIGEQHVQQVVEAFYDMNKVMRNPLVILTRSNDQDVLELLHDRYTKVHYVDLTYIRQPNRFGIQDGDKPCELPIDCFEDLVAGAVRLYLTYKYPGSNQQDDNKKQKQEVTDEKR